MSWPNLGTFLGGIGEVLDYFFNERRYLERQVVKWEARRDGLLAKGTPTEADTVQLGIATDKLLGLRTQLQSIPR